METQEIIRKGEGENYNYAQDHCFIKLSSKHTNGELSFVEDTLKPGFYLGRHHHKIMTEVFYILEGEVTLVTNEGEEILKPGDCAGFPSGEANGHHLINKSDAIVLYLEIGDRTAGDIVTYPDADLVAKEGQGKWLFTHKDNTPYTM